MVDVACAVKPAPKHACDWFYVSLVTSSRAAFLREAEVYVINRAAATVKVGFVPVNK